MRRRPGAAALRLAVLAGCAAALTVPAPASAATQTFSNGETISIPDSGTATPYPSDVVASGLPGAITKVTVTLSGLTHTSPSNLDVLLVGPGGGPLGGFDSHTVVLMSDAGCDDDVDGVNLTFDDAAANGDIPPFGPLESSAYRPEDYDTPTECADSPEDEVFAQAPPAPYGTALNVFNGTPPNGNWSLFVVDDEAGNAGQLANGWSLTITSEVPDSAPQRCAGRMATIRGTTADDEIVGTNKRDVIAAGAGDDKIRTSASNDVICANRGFDTLRGGRGRDLLVGGPGSDLLLGGPGIDRIFGGGLPGSGGKLLPGIIDLCPNARRDFHRGCVIPPP
jgi:Ca2+-binding RTX toxin-like protein